MINYKKIFFLLNLLFCIGKVNAQSLYFPPLVGNTWDTLAPSSLGWCEPEIDTLIDYLGSRDSKAFILLKDGKIVIEKYFGTFTRDSLWYWASAAKSMTSCLVGIAQQEGYLSISDTTSNIIGSGWTSCSGSQEEKITVWNQLTMTSGLDDLVPDKDCTDPACLHCLANPGNRWAYHNAPYTLLDTVLEASTGVTLNTYLAQKIRQPTGMDGLFLNIGYNNVYFSTPRSMARFGLLILNGGTWNGNQVITDTAYFNQMVNTSQSLNQSYGYLWWLNGKSSYMLPGSQFVFQGSMSPNAPNDMFAALGKNGQMLNIVPSRRLVWLRMGNEPNAGFVPNFFNDTIWQKLNAVMCTTTASMEIANQNQFILYPNPANQQVLIKFGHHITARGSIRDLSGRILKEMDTIVDEQMIDLTGISAGIYLVTVHTSEGTNTRRLIIE